MSEKVAPTITSSNPANNVSDISTKQTFKITFSEEVKNVNTTNIVLKDNTDSEVTINVIYKDKVANIKATTDLDTSSSYTLTLKNGITDLYSNALSETTYNFTTNSVAATCDGVIINDVCYEKSNDELTHANAKTYCENNNKTLVSKDSSIDWDNFANELELDENKEYWLNEDIYYLRKPSYGGWGNSSTSSTTKTNEYICMSEKVAPTITSSVPANNASDISTKQTFKITFSEEVKNVNTTNIVLKDNTDSEVAVNITYENKVASIKANKDLDTNTNYTLTLKNAITDLYSNTLSETVYNFTTSAAASSCEGVTINDVCYEKSSDELSHSNAKSFCESSNKTLVSKTMSIDWSDFANKLELDESKKYLIAESGDYLYKNYSGWTTGYTYASGSNFPYICMSEKVAPTITSSNPANNASDISTKQTFKITFSEEVKNVNTTNIVLKDNTDSEVTINVTYKDKVANIKATTDLDTSSSYTLTIKNGITDLYSNALSETTYNFTTNSVAATCDGVIINDVCYEKSNDELTHANAKTYCENNNKTLVSRNASIDWSNLANELELDENKKYWLIEERYYLQKSFSSWSSSSEYSSTTTYLYICMSEKVAPTITSSEPSNSAIDISTKAKLKVTFSEDIKENTLTTSNISLTKSDDSSLSFAISYANKVLTITPSNDFETNTVYKLVLKSGITDLYANTLTETEISFTTNAVASTCSGEIVDGKCYTLISDKKSWSDAASHCTSLGEEILSKDDSSFSNIPEKLSLNQSSSYWLKEEHNSNDGVSLAYSYGSWGSDSFFSSKSKSTLQEFICVK